MKIFIIVPLDFEFSTLSTVGQQEGVVCGQTQRALRPPDPLCDTAPRRRHAVNKGDDYA